ncbi:CpaF family protein [Leucobacter komagatae]|uniref:CpaF family protein n=1 Tax=Leucobacter komagatae TaxID=55969 RepID=UPI000A055F05|nr:ATPase, T2SS/T4P/T4SS family [Leucobacter komagatae]
MTEHVPEPAAPRSASLGSDVRRALGGLLPLVDDPAARDVLLHVTDGSGRLWVDRGGGAERVPGWEVPASNVRALAVALIAAGGRHLDELNPCADVRLGDGIRVHAVLEPVAVAGTVISIRLPAPSPARLTDIARAGLCDPPVLRLLERSVAQKRNILITGGAGSGKTTLLGALLGLVPAGERIVTIEDVAELRPRHSHHVALESRQANIEGAGEIGLDRLLREALRMRPDRIVLGECRGAEIATLLAALNTGHQGGAGTMHANRIHDVPARLEALGMLAGLSATALARQALALDLVVHLDRSAGSHRIREVGTLHIGDTGELDVTVHAADDQGIRRDARRGPGKREMAMG